MEELSIDSGWAPVVIEGDEVEEMTVLRFRKLMARNVSSIFA